MLTNYGLVGLVGGRGPEPMPQFLNEVWRAAWSMTPASHSSKETAGNPGSNPGGRTNNVSESVGFKIWQPTHPSHSLLTLPVGLLLVLPGCTVRLQRSCAVPIVLLSGDTFQGLFPRL